MSCGPQHSRQVSRNRYKRRSTVQLSPALHRFASAIQAQELITKTEVLNRAIKWYLKALASGDKLAQSEILDFDEPRRIGRRGDVTRWDVPVSIALEKELFGRLAYLADSQGKSISQITRTALTQYITARAIMPSRFCEEKT